MKKVKISLIALLALFFIQAVNAQTVDEVIEKYIDAMGGKEKLMSLNSVVMNGSLSVQGMDVGITTSISKGVGSRTDISVPGMGEGFQIMNTTKGWNFFPFQGQASPEEVPADQVKASQSLLDLQGPLINYKEKGNKVALLGKETVDGKEAYKLQVTSADGKISTYFFDTQTYYKIKTISKAQTPQGEMEVETSYSDFKKTAEGYLFPYSITNSRGTIVMSSIDVNKLIDSKIFTAE